VSMESENPFKDYQIINNELVSYDESLKDRRQIVVANKMDVEGAKEKLAEFKKQLGDVEVFPISALTKQGLNELKYKIAEVLREIPNLDPKVSTKIYTLAEQSTPEFLNTKVADGIFDVTVDKVALFFNRSDFNSESAVKRSARHLRAIGIEE